MSSNYQHLHGTGVALVTPFTEGKKIDFAALDRVLEHTSPHVDYLVVNGTTAEAPTMSSQEKRGVLSHVVEKNNGEKPIVYGFGGNYTKELVALMDETDFSGVDAILSVSPYYNKPSSKGLLQHYTMLADASPVPMILYNVPGRTSSNIPADVTLALAEHPNIIGTKEAAGDLTQCMQIAKHKPEDFMLISGDDLLTLPMMSVGGCGAISVIANAFPRTFSEAIRHALQGNFEEASKGALKLFEVNEMLFEEGNPVGVKQALEILGVCRADVRLPLAKASQQLKEKLKGGIELLGVRE